MALRPRPLVAKLDEPEKSRATNDRAAHLLPDLTRQGVEDGLRSLPASPRQDVRAVLVEREDRPTRPCEDRARRDDELERWFLIGEVAREEERSHSPDDVPGGDRGQIVYFVQ